MKFGLISRIGSFFRSLLRWKSRESDERTYSQSSFISHIEDTPLFNLTSQESGVLAGSVDNSSGEMPSIIIYRIYGASLGIAEALPEAQSVEVRQEQDAYNKAVREEYQRTVDESQVVSSSLFKLTYVVGGKVHLIRRIDDGDSTDLKRIDKVQRLLGPYAVKLYHHRYFLTPGATFNECTYISEMEYIDRLRNVKDDIELIHDEAKKAERLLLLVRKMLNLVKYLQKKGLYWPDIKPSNFYLRPDTDEICVADNKNLFSKKNKFLPRSAFTPDYTAPSVFGHDAVRDPKKVMFSEYPDQLHFSFLRTVETLLGLCEKTQPAAQTVMAYLQQARCPHTLSIFKSESILYPIRQQAKPSSSVLPVAPRKSVFARRDSTANRYAKLSWSPVSSFFSRKFSKRQHSETPENTTQQESAMPSWFTRLFGSARRMSR